MADNTVCLPLGYGKKHGRIANFTGESVGFNAYAVRDTDFQNIAIGGKLVVVVAAARRPNGVVKPLLVFCMVVLIMPKFSYVQETADTRRAIRALFDAGQEAWKRGDGRAVLSNRHVDYFTASVDRNHRCIEKWGGFGLPPRFSIPPDAVQSPQVPTITWLGI